MIEFGSRVRLDYQPLFGKMSPHSSPPPPPPHLSSGRIKDCTHAWKKWPQRKGTRRRHTRREGASAREAHENHFYWLFESVESFYWLRGPILHEIHISGSGDRQKICLIIDQRKYSLFRKNFTACIVDWAHTIKTWTILMNWNTYQGYEFEKPFTIVIICLKVTWLILMSRCCNQ